MWLKIIKGEDPLVPRWSAISQSSQVWTEGPLSEEYLRGALHPALAKHVYECAGYKCPASQSRRLVQNQHERILVLWVVNKELKLGANQELIATIELHVKGLEEDVNMLRVELESLKNQLRELEQEVRVLCSSLDGARNDRARLEGDVMSLTEVATLLEAELKAEGSKVVVAYKASRGFESGLKKMGRVSYEFGYRVALERFRRKHPEIAIEFPSPNKGSGSGGYGAPPRLVASREGHLSQTRGRCEASTKLGGVLVVQVFFPHSVVRYM
ncbi:hypothetical protein B296_00008247 [Ensete ventricosum]|uniref:Uncharacterized protein n=1 Tax=Ensete ventricosum TaxID=4639 RepID=A0A426YYX8_ENSVE|nr:hypothetical protein B296_00008247 [Ensete ventricosum]